MMVNLPCLMVSCTNFLRSTCPYTECQPSFQTGSCPTERTTAGYSSCLYLIFTDLLFTTWKLIFQWTLSPVSSVGLVGMQCFLYFIRVYGFLIQNPARFQTSSDAQQGSGILMLSAFILPVPAAGVVLLCPLTSFSDRMSSPLSEW